jgi:hypothetical protein
MNMSTEEAMRSGNVVKAALVAGNLPNAPPRKPTAGRSNLRAAHGG